MSRNTRSKVKKVIKKDDIQPLNNFMHQSQFQPFQSNWNTPNWNFQPPTNEPQKSNDKFFYMHAYYDGNPNNDSKTDLIESHPPFASKSDFFWRYWDAMNAGWQHKKLTKPAHTYELVPPQEFECSTWDYLRTFEIHMNGLTFMIPEYFFDANVVQCGKLNYDMIS